MTFEKRAQKFHTIRICDVLLITYVVRDILLNQLEALLNKPRWRRMDHQYGILELVYQTSRSGKPVLAAPRNFGSFLWLISSSFLFKLYPALRFYFTRVIALWLWIRKCLLTVLRTGCSVWWINTEIWSPYVLLQFVTKTANTFNEKYQNVVRKKSGTQNVFQGHHLFKAE